MHSVRSLPKKYLKNETRGHPSVLLFIEKNPNICYYDKRTFGGAIVLARKEIKMKFKDIRPYISNIDRVSICDKDTLSYVNYQFISDVPESYDDLYLYGIGRIESEFPANKAIDAAVKQGVDPTGSEIIYAECIEFMLSKEPRKF